MRIAPSICSVSLTLLLLTFFFLVLLVLLVLLAVLLILFFPLLLALGIRHGGPQLVESLLHGGLRRGAGGDASKIDLLERRQRAAIAAARVAQPASVIWVL